ncbi:NAD(P)H-binding protein [Streptomyces sp. NBC_01481]|uniref:NAD(P)H-binding protein n=1 Tax=Streptomyces sp. NBC_01481 TaxID=2975869 RepID=UPI002259861F|nr:NAD(P)H-binding protein [Streptomyces sp. NBC_01481]MCX4585130.1 NmrA family NAD(P)-binding protein [Streptomyces sp. NBC_01481]
MTENLKQETVLVTAATGKTGRRVAERLAARGVNVRAGSRKGSVLFDWEDESTWGPALRGADAAYVAYFPDLAAPGAPEAMRALGRVAAASGVGRLVLLSGRGEPDAVVAEEALRESGLDLTVVRASFFAQNFSEGAMYEGVLTGEIPFPAGETAEPFIDADDLADVVVAALTEDGHAGQVHELTGPRLLTFGEVAVEIGRASGREVRYVPVSGVEYAEMLQQFGFPGPESEWLSDLFTMLLDGHNASLTDGVRRVLGREPKDFAAFARDAAGGGAWG